MASGTVRISGGHLRGRRVRVPEGPVRPTQDRVREALFSMLMPVLSGCSFLDLFAGSGVVGLEAWSRGAERVMWVESHRRVASVLKSNVAMFCGQDIASACCRCQDVFSFCRRWHEGLGFDVAYADPPYAVGQGDAISVGGLLTSIRDVGLVVPGGLLVLEQGARDPAPEATGWLAEREKHYGKTCLRIYRCEEEVS